MSKSKPQGPKVEGEERLMPKAEQAPSLAEVKLAEAKLYAEASVMRDAPAHEDLKATAAEAEKAGAVRVVYTGNAVRVDH